MDVGMDVGRLLEWFLVDFGTILGGKLAPSWHQNQKKKWVPKRSQKMRGKKGLQEARVLAVGQGVWALKINQNTPPNTPSNPQK